MEAFGRLLLAISLLACGNSEFVSDYSWDGGQDSRTNADARSAADDATVVPDATGQQSLTIAVVSDLNGSYGSTSYDSAVHGAVAEVIRRQPDLVISTGDMVAGQRKDLDYRAMWRAFHAAVSDPLATAGIPFAVSPGNHDASGYATFAAERQIYVDEWSSRKPALNYVDDASYPLRYAYKVENTLFIALDDTTLGPLGSEQMAWLSNVLATHSAAVKIVYGHVPLYPFSGEKADEIIGDVALENLLNDHNVDAFVSGHHHAYYPGKRSALRLTGMPCLGGGPRSLVGQAGVSARAVVMIGIEGGQINSIEGYPESDFANAIPRSSLPESIGGGAQIITRDDL